MPKDAVPVKLPYFGWITKLDCYAKPGKPKVLRGRECVSVQLCVCAAPVASGFVRLRRRVLRWRWRRGTTGKSTSIPVQTH
eukprot:3832771-Pyramimonas_sp.AAC.1